MANPGSSVSPFLRNTKKAVGSSASPFLRGKAKPAPTPNPWEPVLSFGQTLIDVVSTPLYFVEGAISGAQKGKNPIVSAAENSVAWTQGKRPATGSDILKNAGMSNDFWSSLVADIALDPLTYTPGVVISAPIKAVLAGTKFGAKGLGAAAKGAISPVSAKITKAKVVEPTKNLIPKKLTAPGKLTSDAAYQAQRAAEAKMDKFVYTPVKIQGERSVTAALTQMLASGAEAGYKGARMSIEQSLLKNTTSKINRKTGKAIRKGAAVTAPKFIDDLDVIEKATRAIESKAEVNAAPATLVGEAANATREANIPVLDQAPRKVTPLELAAVQKPKGTITVKSEQAKLAKIDKLVQGIKATVIGGDEAYSKVKSLLDGTQQKRYAFFATTIAKEPTILRDMKLAMTLSDITPIQLLKTYEKSSSLAKTTMVKALSGVVVGEANGLPLTIGNLLTDPAYAGDYMALPAEIRGSLTNIFNEFGNVATKGLAHVKKLNKQRIEDLFGEKIAFAIEKTGAFDPAVKTDEAALKAVLDELPKSAEKSYANFDEFIQGIKAEDIIDNAALKKVLRLLDPESETADQVAKAVATGRSTEVMRSLLISKGTNTVRQTRQNLANLDPEAFWDTTNVAGVDVAMVTMAENLRGVQELDTAAAMATREAAGENLVKQRKTGGLGKFIDDAADSIGRGLGSQIGQIFKGTEAGMSRLGQMYTRAYREDGVTEGFLNNLFSQYVETKVLGSVLGKMTARRGMKEEAALRKGEEFTPRSISQVETEFLARVQLVSDVVLSTFGARVTHVRSVKATKGLKENAYHHYVHIGDVGLAFKEGKSEAFRKLILPSVAFPERAIDAAQDSLSFQAIGDAVSDVLRGIEKGAVVSREAILKSLRKPSPGKKWSAAYKQVVDENIEEFVDFLINPETANAFASIQKNKLKAEVLDTIEPAQRFSASMVEAMTRAYGAMRDRGISSQIEKDRIVRDWMMKFAAVADIFAFSNGSVAREVFRNTARIFFEIGKPETAGIKATEIRKLIGDFANGRENNSEFYKDMMATFETQYQREASTLSQIPGTSDNLIDSAQKAWIVAKDDFQRSVEQLTTDMSPQQVAEWAKSHKALEQALHASRKQMGKAGLETEYWNGVQWVEAGRYNRTAALKALEKMPNRYIYTKSGIIDVAKFLVDGKAVVPTFKQYGKKHTAETRKVFEDIAANRRSTNAKNDKANAQESVLDQAEEFDKLHPDDPIAAVNHMEDELFFQRTDAGRMKSELPTPPQGAKQADEVTNVPTYFVEGSYRTAKAEEDVTTMGLLGQKLQRGAGFGELAPTLARFESTKHNATADTADVMGRAFKFFRKAGLKSEDMDAALDVAVTKVGMDELTNPAVAKLAADMTTVWDSMKSHVIARGLHPKHIEQAFKLMRIDRFVPDWSIYNKPEDIEEILQHLPIGGPPASVMNGLDSLDPALRNQAEAALNQYNETVDAWKREMAKRDDAVGSISMFSKAVAAIQDASSEATLSAMLVDDFNFMNYFPGLSREAARAKALASGEFVKVASAGSGHSLLKWIPEEDNLFPREIAPQIGAMERHYNYTRENHIGKFLRSSMTILGVFKTTQTVLRPGHLVNTAIGDTITSLMRGTNPALFGQAFRIVMGYAGDKVAADWTKAGGDKALELLQGSMTGLTKAEIKEAESGMRFAIAGGMTLDNTQLQQLLRNAGALKGNVSANDEMIQMAEYQSFAAGTDQGAAWDKSMLERMGAKGVSANVKRAWLTATKPAGDAVAYVGNVPRVATALDVLKKGNFKTIEDAEKAIAEELVTYHPTIEALSAFERQKIRPYASYYTWLRGAHVAFLKMSLEHTAAMMIPSKIFYNQALANELEPGSIGNLWGDKNKYPDYLSYSTYGPTSKGPRGEIVYRPAILPLDILDTWNIQFDPTKAIDKQAFDNLKGVGQSVVGKNINMVFQPGLEWLTGADPSTGKPSTVKDLASAGDNLLSNIGTIQLFQGLGLYTPPNKGPESANPLLPRDREVKLQNYFGGMRIMDTETESSKRNATSDYNARMKRMLEQIEKGQ